MPRPTALALGGMAGYVLYLFGVRRGVVEKNFEHVGLWSRRDRKKIVPKLYRNIGRYAADFLRGGKLPPYRLHGPEHYERTRAAGNGTIIVLAHFGNWELLAAIYGVKTADLNVVAMPMRNPLSEAWVLKKRTAAAVKTIPTRNALRGMLAALKRNGITAILIDQYLRAMGTPAPFLGKTASTVRTAAGLAIKTGAVAIPIYALLNNDGSYDIHFHADDRPALGDNATEDESITALQTRHNDIISDWIKKHPEHWFGWFHKRFKDYVEY